jgi:chemotaxis protein methyltransferase CheR
MIPSPLVRKYFLRSKDRSKPLVRVVSPLRSLVMFQRLNLMDENSAVREGSVDALFCRNVIIYFDRDTQCALLSRLCGRIRDGGHLFLGHSETVHGFDLPLLRIASTVYRKIS